ncbi:hypothetical protein EMIHUDRAFT_50643, partial [Emiliania huxleyi CCMP1516]|uniref:Uncharacterized protein n=2 Tax=Emiliania huxleyi TaxID=2903 RepID=A0A0D3KSG6_EMIH1
LDMDVIDVSWMDNNVPFLRHNFWNINRGMIDDLRDILCTKGRGRHLPAPMTPRSGNVGCFLGGPSYV